MKKIAVVMIILLIAFGIVLSIPPKNDPIIENETNHAQDQAENMENRASSFIAEGSFFQWMGASAEELIASIGEPIRRDPSGYGYEWWVFQMEDHQYVQYGIMEGQVITGVTFSPQSKDAPFNVGQAYSKINQKFPFKQEMNLKSEGSYTMQLTEEDLQMRPLVPLEEGWTAQLYFDTVTKKLSAIRVMRNDVLLKLQPYKVVYQGQLPEQPVLSEEEWDAVEAGSEKQILAFTNILRNRSSVNAVQLNEDASKAAFLHSKDMKENEYFSHFSPSGDGLKERLKKEDIQYRSAGENIAAQYVDAAAAVQGWLNSSGHRKTLLSERYTHIGIGVYHRYYTQDFISLP
ncbi:CAP domain-containing protein [Halobacillus salinarum]|uniref:CAP domain-containing protein n=1 Tax=Halobacillus salinarum TaxID=2932257 RepID=A0ABY4EH03_9BACI|nr:CAP domain-containing protein [Halobacillus salinarum]UOQ43158.1 CAP domain-containing protein [Halobacillus salinarum]